MAHRHTGKLLGAKRIAGTVFCKLTNRLSWCSHRRISVAFICAAAFYYFLIPEFSSITFQPQFEFRSIWNPLGNQRKSATWREVALLLNSVRRELLTLHFRKTPPSTDVLNTLQTVMHHMDPGFFESDILLDIDRAQRSVVCPEEFVTEFNNTRRVTLPCLSVRPIHKVVSFVLNPLFARNQNCSEYLSWIIRGISESYPLVTVFVASTPNCDNLELTNYPNVRRVPVSTSASSGSVWNQLISFVSTPFVFLGRDVYHFSNFSLLERLISIIDNDKRIKATGGASRNLTGHWHLGCSQVDMRNYILEYTQGYYVSKNDCMLCDHLSGPFIARTNILRSIPLDTYLPNELLFHDFFLQLKNANYLAATCPDAMHFANIDNETVNAKHTWLPFVRKWELNRILLPQGEMHTFSCEDSAISCKFMETTSRSYLLPPCCLEQYVHAFLFLRNTEVPFELDSGSLLGAVKVRGNIPWDRDSDTIYLYENYSFWQQMKDRMAENGLDLVEHKSSHLFVIWTPDATIEMYGMKYLSNVLLPQELRNFPTLVEVNGEWINAHASPGLFARNRYGYEMLRHSQSWKHHNLKSSFAKYQPGTFLPCQRVNHHACLDRFPTDGNINFIVP